MSTEFIAHYIGQESQSVQKHLEETAGLAECFAGKIGLPSMGSLVGLLHDLGKYSNDFQAYIRSAEGKLDPDAEPVNAAELKGKIDHSTAGAQLVWGILKDNDALSRLVAQIIALCVASHHSGLIDCIAPDGEDKFSRRMTKSRELTHAEEIQGSADRAVLDKISSLFRSSHCRQELKKQVEQLLSAEDSKEVREFYLGLLARFIFSALIDADRLSAAGRNGTMADYVVNSTKWDILIERLEQHILGLKQENWVDELRTKVSLACKEFSSREKGLYQLTVPTGGGKTLSSLRFGLHHAACHSMDRLIYVIPYTSIIDQNAAVARSILEEAMGEGGDTIVLEHHSNLTPEKETPQSRLLSENWDATVIFTTTVQFLETLFGGGTRGVRRLHQLANAVIIFDEIQTLPIRTVHLFNNAINFLVKQCGATVVFCTATQPLLHDVDKRKGAARLANKPEMAPCPDELFNILRRVEVLDKRKSGGWTVDEITQYVCSEARETGSALVVVNTKSAARTLYDLCKQKIDCVYHLSTSMCPAHRIKIIDEIKERLKLKSENPVTKPVICISTQLIEAGVDVDFGSVIRYVAGLESIAQAAGRCNRNGRCQLGKVTMVNPAGESLDKLPEIRKGKEVTERVLHEYSLAAGDFDNNLLSPKAMQRYYKYYFYDRAKDMVYRVSAKEVGHDDDLLTMLSTNEESVKEYLHNHPKSAPVLSLRQSFKSSGALFQGIDAPTDGIIVPYGDEGKRIIAEICASTNVEEARQLLRKAQRHSVNLYPHEMVKLASIGCVYETQKGSGIWYLDRRYYSKEMGVVFEEKGRMDLLYVDKRRNDGESS